MTRTVDRNGGARFTLPLGPTCPFRPEELAPSDEPILCLECDQPVTPGQQHPVEVED